ncbi:MAG: hypothetical protein KF760_20250 [Candidatus Eremiobacteraeota bacterium]|nr:hypothetical protein [Candidatus Eremiobacteraeota bacterium]MCW5868149.1 hypothetical protein [Candidatus Eremiobacteraeota bacterium]
MKIAAQNHQSYTRNSRRSKDGPDDVPPEFPGRHTEPGPDDVYDPDQCGRGSDYGGSAHYYDTDSSGGSAWVLF